MKLLLIELMQRLDQLFGEKIVNYWADLSVITIEIKHIVFYIAVGGRYIMLNLQKIGSKDKLDFDLLMPKDHNNK